MRLETPFSGFVTSATMMHSLFFRGLFLIEQLEQPLATLPRCGVPFDLLKQTLHQDLLITIKGCGDEQLFPLLSETGGELLRRGLFTGSAKFFLPCFQGYLGRDSGFVQRNNFV